MKILKLKKMEMFIMQLVESKGKMVVFDIDDLLVSTKFRLQKYIKDLKIDFNKAQQDYEDGLYYEFDTVIDYAVEIVNFFKERDYTIAYLTGRRIDGFEITYNYLVNQGFPVDGDLLFLKADRNIKTPIHKDRVFTSLINEGYNILYYFDDSKGNLEVAIDLGVLNVYSSISYFFAELTNMDEEEMNYTF